jgi:O-antigen ligase
MSNKAQLGAYSAISAPLLYIIHPFLSIIPIATLLISNSTSSIIGLFFGFIYLIKNGYFKRTKLLIMSGILFLIAYNFKHMMNSYGEIRMKSWLETIEYIIKRPFVGWGYQSFNRISGRTDIPIGSLEHSRSYSDILHSACEFGIPFMIIVGVYFFSLYSKFRKTKRNDMLFFMMASIITGLVNMAITNVFRYAAIGGTFIVILALLAVKLEEVQNDNN